LANATPSYFGEANGAGGASPTEAQRTALFLKVFGGEVITAFEQNTLMLDKQIVRTIASGKSAQFPCTGRITAAYHTPGAEILGDTVLTNEIVLYIDKLLLASAFIASIDEAMSHFDMRSIFSTEMGRKLATCFDQSVLMEVIRGAKAAPPLAIGLAAASKVQYLGASYDGFSVANKAAALATAIFTQAAVWDNQFVPGDRFLALKPVDYNALIQNTAAINADWGGAGAYSDGTVFRIGGVNIIKAPQLTGVAETDTTGLITGASGLNSGSHQRGDAGDTDVRALMFTKDAVGTVKLMDLATEAAWDIRRQGTLMVAKYAMGHGVLNPDGCAYFANDAS
jgi:hypothetical protein